MRQSERNTDKGKNDHRLMKDKMDTTEETKDDTNMSEQATNQVTKIQAFVRGFTMRKLLATKTLNTRTRETKCFAQDRERDAKQTSNPITTKSIEKPNTTVTNLQTDQLLVNINVHTDPKHKKPLTKRHKKKKKEDS